MLEFIVWLLHGSKGLDKFNKDIVNEMGNQCHYFEKEKTKGETTYKIHTAVLTTMDSLSQLPECEDGETALGDLLMVVRAKLLVVDLGASTLGKGQNLDDAANIKINTRIPANRLKEDLEEIIRRGAKNEAYWLKGKTACGEDVPSLSLPMTIPSATTEHSVEHVSGLLTSGSSSSLVVPRLTGSLRVCSAQTYNGS